MQSLKNFWIRKKISKFLSYTFLIFVIFNVNITKSFSDNLKMGESTIQQMIIEAQKHAIDTIKLEPNERSLKIELLIKKYINLDFMSKATTGSFWKKASEIQKATAPDFAKLLELCASAHPKMRFRFSTSNPQDMSLDVLKTMSEYSNICKHIHLPVQSGSDKILGLMNRKHSRQEYLNLIQQIYLL